MWFTHFQVPTVVFLFVAYLVVLLYDTFFYDRYRELDDSTSHAGGPARGLRWRRSAPISG
jgi:hypothetical protein